jgi:hypothetical protein
MYENIVHLNPDELPLNEVEFLFVGIWFQRSHSALEQHSALQEQNKINDLITRMDVY